MLEPLPVDYLQPDEEPIIRTERHPASVIDEWIGATTAAAVLAAGVLVWTLGFQPRFLHPVGTVLLSLIGATWLLVCFLRFLRMRTSRFVITDERVYKSYGRVRFFLLQTTYDKVTDLHVKQSLWGRIGDFGTIRVETAGTGVVLDGVRDPMAFKQQVESAREAFIQRLVGQHAPAAKKETEETAGSDAKPVGGKADTLRWDGRPTLMSLLGNLLGTLLFAFIAAFGLLGSAVTGDAPWLPAAVAVVAGLSAWSLWVRYRYTRFEVHERGVVHTSGWLTRRRIEARYEKVTDVTTYQSILGRLFGFGRITVNTAGSNQAPIVFQGVAEPEKVKSIIDEARGA